MALKRYYMVHRFAIIFAIAVKMENISILPAVAAVENDSGLIGPLPLLR